MKIQDDRTDEQKRTHTWLVVMTDRFMSGWGEAKDGVSYAAWACEYKDLSLVEAWVRSRSDAMRVRVVRDASDPITAKIKVPTFFYRYSYKPKGTGHCHIYVVNEGHASLVRCANCGR